MKKLLLILFSLFTLTSYSQDDVYWTVYDVDTVEEETTTYVTNNYYTDYTSRIDRFHRNPYYVSYWSYYNPYWYSYYPFYNNYRWWWYSPSWWWNGWYSSYRGWYSHHNYSYRHTYAYYQPQYRTSNQNSNKNVVVNKPRKVTNSTTPKYQKPKKVKYIYIQQPKPVAPVKSFKHHTLPPKSTSPKPYKKPSQPKRSPKPYKPQKAKPTKTQQVRPVARPVVRPVVRGKTQR